MDMEEKVIVFTQSDLATIFGISRQAVNKWKEKPASAREVEAKIRREEIRIAAVRRRYYDTLSTMSQQDQP